jgi:L-ascorbate metabolism protein UlaG (beta-lactamase superfamily)
MDWWQFVDVDGLTIHCTPARHFSGRGMVGRNKTLWASWFMETGSGDWSVYFGGDTAYATHFEEIRERLGAPEIAILPVGAYLPRWFMGPVHVNPEEAFQAFLDLDAALMIPVHWGTFDMADDPLREGAELVRKAAADRNAGGRLRVLDIGESIEVDVELRSPDVKE